MSTKNLKTSLKRYEYVLVAAVLILFSLLALGNISRWAIWFDEGYTSYLVRFDYSQIFSLTANDVHPPLYYWALHTWTLMWGNNEFTLRTFSLVCMIIALLGSYVLIKYVTKSRVKALAGLAMLAITPIFIHYADEARMYGMAMAIVMWASYVLLRAEAEQKNRWWVLYGLLIFLGMFTHYYTAFAWLAHWAWRAGERYRGQIKRFWTKPWVVLHVGAIAAYSIWLPNFIHQAASVQSGFWIGPINGRTISNYLGDIFLSLGNDRLAKWWALGYIVIAVVIILLLTRQTWWKTLHARPSGERLLGYLAFVPLVLLILVSMPPLRPTFINRYILYAAAALVLLATIAGFSAWSRGWRWRIALSVCVALCIGGIVNLYVYGALYNTDGKGATRTREIIRIINDSDHDSTPIVVPVKWTYYEAAPYDTASHQVYTIDDGHYQWGSLLPIKQSPDGKIKKEDIPSFGARRHHVWVVSGGSGPVSAPDASWRSVRTLRFDDPVLHKTTYAATLYEVGGN